MLRLKRNDGAQEVAVFWVMGTIQYASLQYREYQGNNIKVDCKKFVMAELRESFHFQEMLGKDWVKRINIYISISFKKNHIRDQIEFIDKKDEKE